MQHIDLTRERGQSVVLIALVMVALVAFLGLVLDGGEAYLTRRDTQNAADAAAFAGARVFAATRPDLSAATTQKVYSAINSYVTANRVVSTNDFTAWYVDSSGNNVITITTPYPAVPSNATGVRVLANEKFQSTFIGVATGGGVVTIPARATVQTGMPGGMGNLMPMTVPITDVNVVTSNALTYLAGDGSGAGNFQWLDFNITACGGAGGANIVSGLMSIPPQCVSPFVKIGDWVGSKSGINPNSQIQSALDQWLPPNMSPSLANWIIPVYDQMTGTGTNVQYHVVEFAEFTPAGYYFASNQHNGLTGCPNGQNKCVAGYFKKWALETYISTYGACNTNPLNTCAISLTE